MKKKYLFAIFTFLFVSQLFSQEQIELKKIERDTQNKSTDYYGASVDIYYDYDLGKYLILAGAPGANKAYLYAIPPNGNQATYLATLQPENPQQGGDFGSAVAIFGDYAVVGAQNEDNGSGNIYIFKKPNGGWSGTLTASKTYPDDYANNDFFGASVDIEDDWIIVGAPEKTIAGNEAAGKVYFYHLNDNGTWEFSKSWHWSGGANAYYGEAVSISLPYAVISVSGVSNVFIKELDNNNEWQSYNSYNLSSYDNYVGRNIHMGYSDFKIAVTGDSKAIVIDPDNGVEGVIDGFSEATSISIDNYLVVGDELSEKVYIFDKGSNETWPDLSTSDAYSHNGPEDSFFGSSVATKDNLVVVGAPYENSGEGNVHLFFYQPSFVSTIDENSIKIYPNPVNTYLNIDAGSLKLKSIEVFDVNGVKLIKQTANLSNQIDLSTLKPGPYLVKITTVDNQVIVKRIIKK